MLIRDQKQFNIGVILTITFVGVLLLIFSPIFGDGKIGLEYSDALFNKLAKDSSYFIPEVREKVKKAEAQSLAVTVKLESPEQAEKATKLILGSGAQVGAEGANVKITGDLGKVLSSVLVDSDSMFKNNADEVKARYGFDGKEAMKLWHGMLKKVVMELQKEKKVDESNIILEVMRKGIEPAFNFYGIQAQSVADKAGVMISLLVFYVAYTMWWGYAIYYLFGGMGLSMKKAKVKKEV